ncbi:MAG: metalloregulator ArsR/SmtB family transcription factor [Acidimicrobiia bacterium]|nr:metalloregulator ArsR/SmtB family transcription factor [Acidimicrobiia bacterium]MDH4307419.1 metalloregulator ArsR/SmtB family transcription factor [Acidimicrobiia bacterium]
METAGDPFGALSDGHRRSILRLLAEGESSVGGLAESLPISRPAVSRHLRLLEEAGLVKHRAEGTRNLYSLDQAGLHSIRGFLEEIWREAAVRFTMFAENTRDT